ncbi:MAG: site-2 protease family protein [Nitrososphaeria archaeon]
MPIKEFSFPLLIIKTERGISFIDKLSKTSTARKTGWIFVVLLPILAATTIWLTLSSIVNILTNPAVGVVIRELGPTINLPWPGLNPYLPVFYGWVALFVGMLVHELAHGIQARVSGVPVKYVGLVFFLILPIGAFVDIDEEGLMKTSFKKFAKILSAGTGTNFLTAAAALFLLLLIVSSLTPISEGILVKQVIHNGPAYNAGVLPGDIVVAVNHKPVKTFSDFAGVVEPILKPGVNMTFTIVRESKKLDCSFTLVEKPDNKSVGYMGVSEFISLTDVKDRYLSAISSLSYREFTLYMVMPTLPRVASLIPFSDLLHPYYVSNTYLGDYYYIPANLLYWIWLLNFNLAIFNAIPLYPLDGGHIFKFGVRRFIDEKKVNAVVYTVSLLLAAMIALLVVAPYLF